MSDHRQAEKPLAIGERRLHTRTPLTPQAFAKFGANNYGFVFNISENGLVFAPTGALTLAVGAAAKMRFQLPDSKEWIETSGEVAWIAESQREAGVRFLDLTEETRAKIRTWISQEPSRPDLPGARDSGRNAIGAPQPATPGAVPEDKTLKSIFADPGLFLISSKSARAKSDVESRPVVAHEAPLATSAPHIPERRSRPRRRVLSLEYLDLGDSNGGIILNLGEDGMYIQAVANLVPDHIANLSFRIPDSGYQVEASGNILWVGESKKDAGIQFVDLPEEACLKIREWVAAGFPSRENFRQPQQSGVTDQFVAKPAADPGKHERLVDIPDGAALKSPSDASNSPVARTSDPKSDFVSKSPSAAIAPPVLQKPSDIPVSDLSSKQTDLAGKSSSGIGEIVARVAQKPRELPVNKVSSKQPASLKKSSRVDAPSRVAHKPVDAAVEQPLANVAQARSDHRGAVPLSAFTVGASIPAIDAPEPSEPAVSSFSLAAIQSLGWKRVAAAVSIVVLISFAAGWIVAGPLGRKQILDKFASQQTDSSQPPENPGATSAQADAPVLGAGLSHTEPSTAGSPERRTTSTALQPASQTPRPMPATAANESVPASAKEKLPASKRDDRVAPSPATTTPTRAPSSNASSAVNLSNTPRLSSNTTRPPAVTSSSSNPSSSTVKPAPPPASASSPSPNTTPSPAQPSVPAAEVVKGTVIVNASPFPSIRVPPELKSQISKQGASLQIGQLISRVEPTYPEDAQHQRIEGVVKLHAIIARDGSVQDIDQMSGPPLLVAAAANAVRQWRYKPTALDGQPVEATEAITVTFRLQPVSAN